MGDTIMSRNKPKLIACVFIGFKTEDITCYVLQMKK